MNRWAHRRIGHRLDAYVDGELEAGPRATIETHLDVCVDCNAVVRLLFETKRSLRGQVDRRSDGPAVRRLAAFAVALARDNTVARRGGRRLQQRFPKTTSKRD